MPHFCSKCSAKGITSDEYICQVCGSIKCSVEEPSEWRPDLTGKESAGNICPVCLRTKEIALRVASNNARKVYFVNEAITDENNELIVCIAIEGETGYYKTDWTWGKDFNLAQKLCDEKNIALGITPREAALIQLRTMRVKAGN